MRDGAPAVRGGHRGSGHGADTALESQHTAHSSQLRFHCALWSRLTPHLPFSQQSGRSPLAVASSEAVRELLRNPPSPHRLEEEPQEEEEPPLSDGGGAAAAEYDGYADAGEEEAGFEPVFDEEVRARRARFRRRRCSVCARRVRCIM